MSAFLEKSYKNTRTKKEVILLDDLFFGTGVHNGLDLNK